MKTRKNFKNNSKKEEHRINDRIYAKEVRITGDNIDNAGEIVSTKDALDIARKLELDLVEISPNATPPVVKVLDYSKFLYEQRKRKKEQDSKSKNKEMKEIRLGVNISDNDINTKKKKIEEFLIKGHKVKLTLRYKGREFYLPNAKEKGELMMLTIADDFAEICKPESLPKLAGRQMIMIINPKK